MSSFGFIIAQARKAKHISQKELATRISKEDGESISPQFINDIERDRRVPAEFIIGKLSAELNLDKDHLCLLTGVLPKDLAEPIAAAPPETVTNAFRMFRKRINRR